jgi:hypothetical protein
MQKYLKMTQKPNGNNSFPSQKLIGNKLHKRSNRKTKLPDHPGFTWMTSEFRSDHGEAMTWSRSDHHPGRARMTCGLRLHHEKFHYLKAIYPSLTQNTYLEGITLVLEVTRKIKLCYPRVVVRMYTGEEAWIAKPFCITDKYINVLMPKLLPGQYECFVMGRYKNRITMSYPLQYIVEYE